MTDGKKIFPFIALFMIAVLPLLGACSGSNSGSGAPVYEKTIQQMTEYIEQQMAASGVKGLSIVLVDNQRTVWARGFGRADVAKDVPATADTQFEIGSNSKTFAGVMIAQLVERGLIRIDDPLTLYLTDFSVNQPLGFPAGGSVTIRNMMTHHSGIAGDVFNGAFTIGSPRPNMYRWLRDYLRTDYLDFPTDFVLSYSNTAAALTAEVIAAATGIDFATNSEILFDTLGMNQTAASLDSPKAAASMSKSYRSGQEVGPFYCNIGPAGSIISTANDMARYVKMIMAGGMGERGRVMAPATLEMMLATQPYPPLDHAMHTGFFWIVNDADLDYAGRLCWHNGGTAAMMSHMEILRDHKLAVVVLSNTAEAGGAVANIAKHALKLALEEKTGIKPPPPFAPEYSPPVTWDQAKLDGLTGIYVRSNEGYMKVTRTGGALQWTDGAVTTTVIPRANGWFSAADSQALQYEFTAISGRDVIVAHGGNSAALLAEKYTPVAIPAEWHARVGTWDAVNLDPDDFLRHLPGGGNPSYELSVADGMLLWEDTRVVQPVDAARGYVRGLGRNMGTAFQVFIVGDDNHEELQYLGVRFRKR